MLASTLEAWVRTLRRAVSASRSEKTTPLDSKATASNIPRKSTNSSRQLEAIRRRAMT